MIDTASDSSIVSSQSKKVLESKTKSSILHVSAQRPNTMQDEVLLKQRYEDPGQSTSDEDQEDLPYDGDLGSHYFNQTGSSQDNMSSNGRKTVHASPDVPDLHEFTTGDRGDTIKHLVSVEPRAEKPTTVWQTDANTKKDDVFDGSKLSEEAPSCTSPADGNQQPDINQLWLRHLTQEELLQSGRLIEAETLPEVSLLESVDDTLSSWAPIQISAAIKSNHSESHACNTEMNKSFYCGRTHHTSNTASKNSSFEEETEKESSKQGSSDNNALDVANEEKSEEDGQVQKVPLVRTRSFSEMKYGQGQVHYPLPDFSKVAPKVKIPKAPSSPARPVPQVPSTMHRAQSSPGILEVISKVLEDSIQPSEKPYVFKDPDKQTAPALVHHLQVGRIMIFGGTFCLFVCFLFACTVTVGIELTFVLFLISLG